MAVPRNGSLHSGINLRHREHIEAHTCPRQTSIVTAEACLQQQQQRPGRIRILQYEVKIGVQQAGFMMLTQIEALHCNSGLGNFGAL